MSQPILELESLLTNLVIEHRRMLGYTQSQQEAMQRFDLKGMDQAQQQQEASRLRIAGLENRRRMLVIQMARACGMATPPTLTVLAQLNPQRAAALLKLRDDLKQTACDIQRRTHVVSRLAGAVMGHLNTAVRLLAGAVEQAGVYTRQGTPRLSSRIGVMEAVG